MKQLPAEKATDFISVYRVSLVKDPCVSFKQNPLDNAIQAHRILRELIRDRGQSDREQFCVALLNAKNIIIGLNIVATGGLTNASVFPREVMKAAILGNACSMILCHNHPSNDTNPSAADIAITKKIIQAAIFLDIIIHEHLIISMEDNAYYSFAESGLIDQLYRECKKD